jgi:hypothetical protein
VALNDSLWHFVVGTVSTLDRVIRFYLDGQMTLELPFEGTIGINDGDIFIGRHYLLGRHYSGLIDEVRVFDGSLSPPEVWSRYQEFADVEDSDDSSVTSTSCPAAVADPNPFVVCTTIRYSLPRDGSITIRLFDVSGRVIRDLLTGEHPAGRLSVVWDGRAKDGRELPAGIYLVRVTTSESTSCLRVVLVR